MKKDLPSVFANKIDKKIENNKTYSISPNIEEKIENKNEFRGVKIGMNIEQKINSIFASPKYVYKANVVIITDNGEQIKQIIGRNGNNLITMDNELISIDSIKDIYFSE